MGYPVGSKFVLAIYIDQGEQFQLNITSKKAHQLVHHDQVVEIPLGDSDICITTHPDHHGLVHFKVTDWSPDTLLVKSVEAIVGESS